MMSDDNDCQTDDALIVRVAQGCQESFAILYARWKIPVRNIISGRGVRKHLVEDMCQEVWMRVATKASLYRSDRSGFKYWLFRVAKNICLDSFKTDRFTYLSEESPMSEDSTRLEDQVVDRYLLATGDSLDRMAFNEELEPVLAAFCDPETMSRDQAEVMSMHIFCGLSLPEIAEMKGIPLPTCKGRYRHAKLKLQEAIGIVTPASEVTATAIPSRQLEQA